MCALAPFLGPFECPFGLWTDHWLGGDGGVPFGLSPDHWLGGGDGVPGWSVVLGSPAAGGDLMEQLVDGPEEGSLGRVSRWGASPVVGDEIDAAGDEMDAAGRGSLWSPMVAQASFRASFRASTAGWCVVSPRGTTRA